MWGAVNYLTRHVNRTCLFPLSLFPGEGTYYFGYANDEWWVSPNQRMRGGDW